MILRKPYGFLIRHFKLIHLILTGLYIYLTIKVNGMLQYYNDFIVGSASKLDAINYVTSYYWIAVILSIIICAIVYALMRYKKKPRFLYLVLSAFSLIVAFMINYAYQGLDTIYISVLDTKSLLLYRDLLRILIIFQYITVFMVLVRGLGFDIKKFNFVQDLQELGLEVDDEEEVELTLGGTETFGRKFHRNIREFKYYYIENKNFIIIIIMVSLIVGLGGFIFNKEVIKHEYQESEVFKSEEFNFQVLKTYVTNRDDNGQNIMDNDTSFVIVKMNVGSLGGAKDFNTGNLILRINQNSYSVTTRYSNYFIDMGDVYKKQKIGNMATYLFVYNVDNTDLKDKMQLVYAEDKKVNLVPVFLDKEEKVKKLMLGDVVNLSSTSLSGGSFKISSFEIKDKFSYPYKYEINGKVYTNQLSISSVQGVVMNLKLESIFDMNIENYSFLEKYANLYYKVGDEEYTSKVFSDKTPGDYKEGLYLSVDKKIKEASGIWFEIKVRDQKYIYSLK